MKKAEHSQQQPLKDAIQKLEKLPGFQIEG